MTGTLLLRDLGVILVGATVMTLALRPLRVPAIVAFILAGILLGPVTGLVGVAEELETISEIGVALLLFLVGLELSFDKIRDLGRVSLLAGLGQVALTAVGGFGLSLLLGFTAVEGAFIATALTFSSTVVVVKLLDQKQELDALHGRMAVGILLVQDLVVVVALTVLTGLARQDTSTLASAAGAVALSLAGMTLLLAVSVLSSRYLLPRVFLPVMRMQETTFIWSICWCFVFILAAEALAVSVELGAFLAGISLAQLPYTEELRRRVHPLMNFFLAVFFVSLGVHTELEHAARYTLAIAVLSFFVLLGKTLGFLWIIGRLRFRRRTAFLTSVSLAQISEFSFIFAALGLSAGLIDEGILSLIAVVGLVTIVVSSYMILYSHELHALLSKVPLPGWAGRIPFPARAGADREAAEEDRFLQPNGPVERLAGGASGPAAGAAPGEKPVGAEGSGAAGLEGHVIVVGMNNLGRKIALRLAERGESVVVVDIDPGKVAALPSQVRPVLGSAENPSVLGEAGLDTARLLVSALQIEETNKLLAHRCRSAGIPVAIHAFNPSVEEDLQELEVDHLMASRYEGALRFTEELRSLGILRGE